MKKHLTVAIPAELHAQVQSAARAVCTTNKGLVVAAINAYLSATPLIITDADGYERDLRQLAKEHGVFTTPAGVTVYCIEHPDISRPDNPCYEAKGVDTQGNLYFVRWEPRTGWDETADAAEHCDWQHPSEFDLYAKCDED